MDGAQTTPHKASDESAHSPARSYEEEEAAPPEEKAEEDEVLLEDEDVGFKSFEIIELLGQGTFGKVFKVKKVGTDKIYAMKVLKKSVLVKNKHLKYAITECNVLKRADHPYIIKMHFSF